VTTHSNASTNTAAVKAYLQDLQQRIVAALEAADGKTFLSDSWERPEGGGGTSRLLEEGNLLERGGVGFSHVMGKNLPPRRRPTARNWRAAPGKPWACRWCCIRAIPTCRRCT
jgi:coproporphyrinogen III oxidase